MVKSIFLQDGEEIFVDDEDYERVNEYKWTKYFSDDTRIIATKINGELSRLCTFISGNAYQILNNNDFTRSNLTDKGKRNRWSRPHKNSTSKYKGVSYYKRDNKWTVTIEVDNKKKYLGRYMSEDEAARVYNNAVIEYWSGEGFLNIIGEDNRAK
ncbi:AP2 domain-containing protein [Macrococcoides goetzii]|nr:AP2 domain-containing protein [Macrococcus goetzii]TDM39856.1 AP2 domain-containing protein [Macrococcus goetzii]